MLEIGFVVGAGGEEDDARVFAVGRSERGEILAKGDEIRSEPQDVAIAEWRRERAAEDDAILQTIAGARRRLRAVGQDLKGAVLRCG